MSLTSLNYLLFLDVDGVLNSAKYFTSDKFKSLKGNLSEEEIMLTRHDLLLDEAPISLLNSLVEQSQAKVVLSSTWRNKFSLDEMNKLLSDKGATFNLCGKTPRLLPKKFSMRVYRHDEIQDYLNNLNEIPESFVILDDEGPMSYLDKFFVKTNYEFGLQEHHITKALKILRKEFI